MLCIVMKVLLRASAEKETKRLKGFKFRPFIGCFQMTSWQWRCKMSECESCFFLIKFLEWKRASTRQLRCRNVIVFSGIWNPACKTYRSGEINDVYGYLKCMYVFVTALECIFFSFFSLSLCNLMIYAGETSHKLWSYVTHSAKNRNNSRFRVRSGSGSLCVKMVVTAYR